MMLLIDAGNSRVKFAICDGSDILDVRVTDSVKGERGETAFRDAVSPALTSADRVIVANVAGERFAKCLADLCSSLTAPSPEFLGATRRLCGVVNGYANPSQLGVDRWMAVVAAYVENRTDLLVIDAGSALTIDAVDANGRHLGGCIAPGLDMMRAALLRDTSDLAELSRDGSNEPDSVFANNTRAAIASGCWNAVAGLVQRALREQAARTRVRPRVVVTGGNAFVVESAIPVPSSHVPDLVLRGLALAAMECS